MQESNLENVWGNELQVTGETSSILIKISHWTKFLSILGFVLLGIMAISIIGMGIFITGMNSYEGSIGMHPYSPGVFSWTYAFVYLLMLIVYFFPIYYLYRFSGKIREALFTNNDNLLAEAFNFLSRHYMLVGVLVIIGLVFFLISCIYMMMNWGMMM